MRELNRSELLYGDPPEGVDRIVSCADHDGVARQLLAAFKFRGLTELSTLVGGFMADAAGSAEAGGLLVPVPPARLRTWLRGFDPVELLAREVAGRTGLELSLAPLRRRGSRRQRGRGRSGRIADPPDVAPAPQAAGIVAGRRILLIDDVITTGATLSVSAMALRQSGAGSVSALTFTRRL